MLAYSYIWVSDSITSISCAESMDFGTPAIAIRIRGYGRLGKGRFAMPKPNEHHLVTQVMNDVTEFSERQACCVRFIYRCAPNDLMLCLVIRLHNE